MKQFIIEFSTNGQGLYPITHIINDKLQGNLSQASLLNCFIQHTSCSLIIQENSDPTARQDMEKFLNLIVPDNQPWHLHTLEGADDTTSHLKSLLTATSLNIPVVNGKLGLGTWQGVYLWEHRRAAHTRRLILTLL